MASRIVARRFKLAPGLQEVLKVIFESSLVDEHRKVWQSEIDAGEIGDETLAVLDAMHLISSRQDARISPIEAAKPSRPDPMIR
jgi:hypothetical protein